MSSAGSGALSAMTIASALHARYKEKMTENNLTCIQAIKGNDYCATIIING